MSRPNRREKVISIRVTTDEFNNLQNLCEAKGVGTISQLARVAMNLLARGEDGNGKVTVESRMTEMSDRMTALDREVARLSSHLGLGRLEEPHELH